VYLMDYIQMIPERGITLEGAILEYDKSKAWWRKLFRFDPPAIRALKKIDLTDRNNLVKMLGYFIENRSDEPFAFHLIYHALMQCLLYDSSHQEEINKGVRSREISEMRLNLSILYKAGLLTL